MAAWRATACSMMAIVTLHSVALELPADIRFQNMTNETIRLVFRYAPDQRPFAAYPLYASTDMSVPVAPGQYYMVVTRGRSVEELGWRDFSRANPSIIYQLGRSAPAPANPSETPPVGQLYIMAIPAPRLRLGVECDDSGAVTRVYPGYPATRLRRVGEDDGTEYELSPGVSVITHVNGTSVGSAREISEAVAGSGPTLNLRVYNRERQESRNYWTFLGD